MLSREVGSLSGKLVLVSRDLLAYHNQLPNLTLLLTKRVLNKWLTLHASGSPSVRWRWSELLLYPAAVRFK